MKYIITRTSIWKPDVKPIDGAIKEQVHDFVFFHNNLIVSDPIRYQYINQRCRDIIKLPDGQYRGIEKEPTEVWVLDIEDLNDFCQKNGEIIMSWASNEEGLMRLEIYDDYRE